jgi:hypothetical protein
MDGMMKLYYVTTVVPKFEMRLNVPIHWIVDERAAPVQRPYIELIEGYVPDSRYRQRNEDAINELFDASEAEALVRWLKVNSRAYGDAKILEAKLPFPNNVIGLKELEDLKGSRLLDFLCLKKISGELGQSPLGFTVLGYFDLEGLEIDPFAVAELERAKREFLEMRDQLCLDDEDFPF